MLKAEVIAKMQEYYQDDSKRIDHALQVLYYAERLMERSAANFHREVVV